MLQADQGGGLMVEKAGSHDGDGGDDDAADEAGAAKREGRAKSWQQKRKG